MFGFKVPFNIHTCKPSRPSIDFCLAKVTDAALMVVGSQVTYILRFFLSRNIRIARDRAWDQTVASRGKGPDFWQPYVEEWEHPPRLKIDSKQDKFVEKWLGGWFGLFIIKRGMYDSKKLSLSGPQRFGLVLLSPFQVYPFVGLAVTAWFKALGTSHFLHQRVSKLRTLEPVVDSIRIQYFEAKKMTKQQIAVYMEEQKWSYRSEHG